MAPLKFEEEIKEKIQARSIEPSTKAWDTLQDRLQPEYKRRRRVWWYFAAASVVGLGIILFSLKDEAAIGEGKVVDTNTKQKELPINSHNDNGSKPISEKEETVVDVKESSETMISIDEAGNLREIKDTNQAVAMTKKDKGIKLKDNILIEEKIVSITEEESIADLVEKAKLLQQQNNQVTDAEIDSLLEEAEKVLAMSRMIKKDEAITAESLLLDVENELERSFREKVFEALKDNYIKVKTAVADRNN
ncbi:hypothetical protein ACFQ1M_17435 [Sungkyunkwania multivorans]|uniref:Uncharacterized protein n=1 Tax=Sungkyunkwania multivorans TaxID=1173618 RepID=A0ABW3D628_9FLAO